MSLVSRFTRIASAVALVALTAAPAFAGPAETKFLQTIAGSWSGSGKLTGAQSGPINCKVVFKAANQKTSYQGRCNVPDIGAKSFSGGLTYNDAQKRYEIRSAGGSVPGVRRGNSLIFTTKSNSMGGTSYSTMTISASRMVIDFTIIDRKTNDKTTSRVTLSK